MSKDEIDKVTNELASASIKPHPREGWAADSKALAEAGEDGLVWPEFANADDDDWEW